MFESELVPQFSGSSLIIAEETGNYYDMHEALDYENAAITRIYVQRIEDESAVIDERLKEICLRAVRMKRALSRAVQLEIFTNSLLHVFRQRPGFFLSAFDLALEDPAPVTPLD
jgi:hypothetical protein